MNRVINLKEAGQILLKRNRDKKLNKEKLVRLAMKHYRWVELYHERMDNLGK